MAHNESSVRPRLASNDLAVRRALEAVGVEFINEDGGGTGPSPEAALIGVPRIARQGDPASFPSGFSISLLEPKQELAQQADIGIVTVAPTRSWYPRTISSYVRGRQLRLRMPASSSPIATAARASSASGHRLARP
jgi:hypothetical protein